MGIWWRREGRGRGKCTDEGVYPAQQPDEPRHPFVVPAAEGVEFGEDEGGRALRGEVDHGDQDGEESEDVDDEDEAFDLGQEARAGRVDGHAEGQHGEEEEGAVVALVVVVGVVEHEQALDDGAAEETAGGCDGLPAEDGHPACKSERGQVSGWSWMVVCVWSWFVEGVTYQSSSLELLGVLEVRG